MQFKSLGCIWFAILFLLLGCSIRDDSARVLQTECSKVSSRDTVQSPEETPWTADTISDGFMDTTAMSNSLKAYFSAACSLFSDSVNCTTRISCREENARDSVSAHCTIRIVDTVKDSILGFPATVGRSRFSQSAYDSSDLERRYHWSEGHHMDTIIYYSKPVPMRAQRDDAAPELGREIFVWTDTSVVKYVYNNGSEALSTKAIFYKKENAVITSYCAH